MVMLEARLVMAMATTVLANTTARRSPFLGAWTVANATAPRPASACTSGWNVARSPPSSAHSAH